VTRLGETLSIGEVIADILELRAAEEMQAHFRLKVATVPSFATSIQVFLTS
jgi:hypothetical protein